MGKGYETNISCNSGNNAGMGRVLKTNLGRRLVLKAGFLGGILVALPACATRGGGTETLLGFKGLPVSTADVVTVPPGYRAQMLYAWGDAIGPGGHPNSSTCGHPKFLHSEQM